MVEMTNKYNAKKTEVDGILFDSKREASRYQELKLMQRIGEISDLELQPMFTLQEGFKCKDDTKKQGFSKIAPITYIADFKYIKDGRITIEDSKGFRTEVFKIKRKMFLYHYMRNNEIDFIES